jgi:hypothetical protein
MPVDPKSIKCKACSKDLATVTDSGLIPTLYDTVSEGCETCQQFRPLFDAMEAADTEYRSFRDRRDNYRPKQDALLGVRRTHIDFNNWLSGVESSPGHSQTKEVNEPQGEKRPRSLSQSSETSAQTTITSSQYDLNKDARHVRKRFRFAGEVEFREDYRPSQNYARSDETYIPGRYAPPEDGEHLDTSGSAKTFLRFTGMKKVGKEWVDVWNNEEGSESKKGGKRSVSTSNEPDANAAAAAVSSTTGEDTNQLDAAPMDARAQRLARRAQPRQNVAMKRWTGTPSGSKPVSTEELSESAEIVPTTSFDTAARARSPTKSSQQTNGKSHDTARPENRYSEKGTTLHEHVLEEMFCSEGGDGNNEADSVSAKARQNIGESQHEHDLTTPLDGASTAHQETPALEEPMDTQFGIPKKVHVGEFSTGSNAGDMSGSHDRPAVRMQVGPYNDSTERHNDATTSSHSVHSTEAHPVGCAEGHAQHLAAGIPTGTRNAGTNAAGEMLVIASRAGKETQLRK